MTFRSSRRCNIIVPSLIVICLYRDFSIRFHSFLKPLKPEVETYATPSVKNIATGKTATQSSTLGNFSASRAIDGSTNTYSHTDDENAWLQIDLGDVYPIHDLKIVNRWCVNPEDPSGCLCRLSDVTLTLIDDRDSAVATELIGNTCGLREVTVQFDASCSISPPSHRMTPKCFPLAKKVKLQSTTGRQINVFEVRVFSAGTSTDRQSNHKLIIPVQNKSVHGMEGLHVSKTTSDEHSPEEKVFVKLHNPTISNADTEKVSIEMSIQLHANDDSQYGNQSTKLHNSTQPIANKITGEFDTKAYVEESMLEVHSQNISDDLNTPVATTLASDHKKYLLFNSHGGFSNQYFCLRGAIALAAKMKRTLVLPPLNPHCTTNDSDLKFSLRYRKAKENATFETIKFDIGNILEGVEVAEWSELFDFTLDAQEHNRTAVSKVSVIELRDFVREKKNQVDFDQTEMICNSVPCPISDLSKYAYELSSQVAYVGSTFHLGFRVNVPFWKPSRKMFDILRQVYGRVYIGVSSQGREGLLPRDYVGLHVRVTDETMIEKDFNCDSQQFTNNFETSEQHHLWKYFSQGKVIFLGTSSTFIKECVVSLATAYYEKHQNELGSNRTSTNKYKTQVVMIDDILNHDSAVINLIQKMQVETSTAMVALDQFLIGLAPDIMLVNMLPHTSTFQRMVELIHAETYRNYILSYL